MTALGVKQNFSVNAGHGVASEVHLETTTGLLVGRTRTWSTVLWTSVQSAAQALVFDADGDVLADSGMGDQTVGEDMRWPDDEMPWATWPGGRCVFHAAFHPTVPTEHESHRDREDFESVAELAGERRA
jgi:hypothetical protein